MERPVPPALQTMAPDRIFWSHFSPNLAPAAWVIGVLVVSLGLSGWRAFVVVLAGNVLGALPVAACAAMGPDTGLPQMEASRFSFGSTGKRLPALINWVNCIGWDAVNNVPSAIALILLARIGGSRCLSGWQWRHWHWRSCWPAPPGMIPCRPLKNILAGFCWPPLHSADGWPSRTGRRAGLRPCRSQQMPPISCWHWGNQQFHAGMDRLCLGLHPLCFAPYGTGQGLCPDFWRHIQFRHAYGKFRAADRRHDCKPFA
ncbi:cytosine permease [Komagataeibacter rhaeticus]|nr:cytosine permease [Komagataeibacter rhaeticus]